MDQNMLRSGKLAELTGVSTDLLRHYERIGILPFPARSSNGYRLYAPQMVERVLAVRRSVSLGFSLAELSLIFAVRDRGGVPCRSVRTLAGEKLRCVEQSLAELKVLRGELKGFSVTGIAALPGLPLAGGRAFLSRWRSSPPGTSLIRTNQRKDFHDHEGFNHRSRICTITLNRNAAGETARQIARQATREERLPDA